MRCHICNTILNENEIKIDARYGEFDPCGNCLTIISEVFEDYLEDDEVVEDGEDDLDELLEESA